ncbi:hypothetical protein N7466_003834 [Penicillium verhagenii]|uniref:uncharacterized protein n=1 Tax=Penicillium verhagenii TaxID=1562060 RepID=UPI002544F827|nr:uncharacterized protein N7466_003834 [Penicillium verhagenii]KAJ5934287.1 hypothetical protein N7466_003834 [Penicillium verhagenii]
MPRQQTNLRGPKDREGSKGRPAPKRKSTRAINALSIAEKQITTKLGVRRNRLGFYDDGTERKFNNRGDDEDGEDEDGEVPNYKRRRFNNATEDGSLNGGSDSEGHEWKLGQVDSDDDESLDSDEALGESDEERFEGFTFRGSSKPRSAPKKPTKKRAEISLSEDVDASEESEDEDEEDDELGEDAVDLLTAWDMNTAEEEAEAKKAAAKSKKAAADDSEEDSGSEADSEEDLSDDTGLSLSDDEEFDGKNDGLSKLQDFVNSMETGRRTKSTQKSQEQSKPTEYGLTSSKKLTVADLLPSITDSRLKSSLKHVEATAAQTSKSGIPGKLDAPLAKRQQDKIDRAAAYEKSKETLDRWIDTVKHNRRADHLMFPLPDPDNQQVHRLDVVKPTNDLESTIQSILVESGLAETHGKSAEEQVAGFEDIQARTLPLEEIQARRAELRKRRDLLFREEVRAKRIKKIKSKSYRRVHRKERERLEQQEQQALMEAGVDMDEMDIEKNERMRAEARMGSKHRDSKWAKSLKETGRTAWDADARNDAADLALREEELRRRVEGKSVSRGDDTYLESSSSESEDDDPWASDASDVEKRKIEKKLRALDNESTEAIPKGRHSDLFEMKFMQNADAARKQANDAELRRLNRELNGEDPESEAESEVGRRKFGQSKPEVQTKPLPRNEFEEKPGSDDEDIDIVVDRPVKSKSVASDPKTTAKPSTKMFSQPPKENVEEENPWLVQTERTNRRRTGTDAQDSMDISVIDDQPQPTQAPAPPKKSKSAKAASSKKRPHDENDSDDEDNVPVLLKNHDLVKRAFAGDEVVEDFEQEKMDTVADEGDKVVDNTLDGWGSWAGDGVSKKAQKNKKRFLTTEKGVNPEKRKDAKLARVIINEKRVKKNIKYMASQLPHQYETKAQYERSLRMPLGPEWSTKETFQSGTKPRVIVKQGIIKPMEKPMK